MGVTIKDIAQKCGLSITTVSLVLNNKDSRISEKTRQTITEAAQELNYVPNRMAVGLATKKTFSIGLILSEYWRSYYTSLIHATEAACINAGFQLMLYYLPSQSPEDIPSRFQMLRQQVDGIIFDPSFYPFSFNEELHKQISGSPIPIITLAPLSSKTVTNAVMIDHCQAAWLASSALLQQGHKKIGFLSPPSSLNLYSLLRTGYEKALDDYELQVDSELIAEINPTFDNLTDVLNSMLNTDVTAFISYSDTLCAKVYQFLHQKNISVPDQISLACTEDSPFFSCMNTSISAVSIHADRAARKSVNLLRKIICDNQPESAPEFISPFFQSRNSILSLN